MTHERQARLLFAKGYSCEQAVYGAFADVLGMSTVGAMLMAPPRKERGPVCGAYRAGLSLISILTNPELSEKKRPEKRVERAADEQQEKTAAAQAEFRILFLGALSTLDCAQIKRNQETGWSGMDDVIGITVRLVERVLGRAQEKP